MKKTCEKKAKNFLYIFVLIITFPALIFSIPTINSVIENSDPVGQYNKFELTINLTANYSNPYDPEPSSGGLDLWAIFTSPSGVTKRVNGFYMDTNNDGNGDSWKIRFATGETGNWTYTIYARDNTGQGSSSQYSFSVTQSTNKGFIRPSTINPRFFVYENGGNFWGIGHNNGWQNWQNVENPNMATMASYGENVLVFWSNTPWQNNPSQDRERMPMEYAGSGTDYWQWNGYFIDKRLENAEANGIKIILCLWIHDNLKNSSSWWNLEYKNICSSSDFFDNASSLARQQKYHRYAIARWGYSRALFMWDLLVEASLTDGWVNKGPGVVETWLQNTVNYFKQNDPFGHPVTASLHGGWDSDNSDLKWPNGWTKTGVSQIHSYAWKDDMTKSPIEIAHDTKYMWQILNQPNFIGEFGTSNSSNQPTSIHRGVWAGLASGAACSPMLWCDGGSWKFMDTNMLNSQKYVAQFVSDIDFENMITEQKSVTVNGYYAWGVGSPEYAIVWMFNPSGNIGTGKTMIISSFNDGNYKITWYNTWTGENVSTVFVVAYSGIMSASVPQINYPDIACKISKSGPTPTFTPTFTFTITKTSTQTYTLTYTATNTRTFTSTYTNTITNTPGGPTETPTYTNTITNTRTNTPTVTNTSTPLPDIAKYNFEDGTMQGFYLDTSNAPQGVSVANSTDYAIGIRSAKLQVNFTGNGTIWNQGAIAHNNQSPVGIVKAKVYVPSGVTASLKAKIYLQDSSWQWRENTIVNLTTGSWTEILWDLSSVTYGNPVNKIGVIIGSYDNYNGYIYIDSIDYLEQGEPTRTFTNTPVNTATFTNTQTWTLTNTPTNTATHTNTSSFTVTSSFTNTFTFTRTNTVTPTDTNTATNTAANTSTNTPTPTNTGINTGTNTETNTETVTGTQPPTWTYTNTATQTNTFTYTNTATNTPVQTNTSSHTPSFSATQTNTLTPGYTATFTFTQTNTSSSTVTFTQTQVITFTPTLTPVLTFIPTETENFEIINDSIIIYPQPYSGEGDAYIKFRITKNASEIKIRIYTVAFRFVKEFEQKKQFNSGENEIRITEMIKPLASGLYYYSIDLNNGKQQTKSKINKFIVIK
jgi:hypothetical protein